MQFETGAQGRGSKSKRGKASPVMPSSSEISPDPEVNADPVSPEIVFDLQPEPVAEMNMVSEGPSEPENLSTSVSQERIADRAYEIWMSCGCPEGQELEHWLQAEKELQSAP